MFLIFPGSLHYSVKKNLDFGKMEAVAKISVLTETFHKYGGRKPAGNSCNLKTSGKAGGVLRIKFNG